MTDMTDAAPPRPMPVWVIATIAGVFGLFYAYAVWNALAFLLIQATGPLGLNGYGWALLLSAVLFPLVAFAIAFWLGYRRRAGEFALALLAGLALVAVFWLNVVSYATVSGNSLVAVPLT